jgi:hypothetical protein
MQIEKDTAVSLFVPHPASRRLVLVGQRGGRLGALGASLDLRENIYRDFFRARKRKRSGFARNSVQNGDGAHVGERRALQKPIGRA